jgi:hypothetical protein
MDAPAAQRAEHVLARSSLTALTKLEVTPEAAAIPHWLHRADALAQLCAQQIMLQEARAQRSRGSRLPCWPPRAICA